MEHTNLTAIRTIFGTVHPLPSPLDLRTACVTRGGGDGPRRTATFPTRTLGMDSPPVLQASRRSAAQPREAPAPPRRAEAGAAGATPADGVPGASEQRSARAAPRPASGRSAAPPREAPAPPRRAEAGAAGATPADGVRGHRSSAARAAREQRTGPRSQLTRWITPSYSEIP